MKMQLNKLIEIYEFKSSKQLIKFINLMDFKVS